MKGLSLLFLGLLAATLLLVHGASYRPAVSYILLYLTSSVILTAAVALLLLPAHAFGEGFCVTFYLLYAATLAAAAFFTGGVSSELYVAFFPLVLASGMHGTWRIGLPSLAAVPVCYALAMLPDVLEGSDGAVLVFYRIATLALVGAFALVIGTGGASASPEGDHDVSGGDGSLLLERVSGELAVRRRARVGVVLVDLGGSFEDLGLLMGQVGSRIGEPVPLGRDGFFGLVLAGADERAVWGVARRTLASAGAFGARETRAGAAVYPRDASSAEDLLLAAQAALEAALAFGGPGAVFLAGHGPGGAEPSFQAAR